MTNSTDATMYESRGILMDDLFSTIHLFMDSRARVGEGNVYGLQCGVLRKRRVKGPGLASPHELGREVSFTPTNSDGCLQARWEQGSSVYKHTWYSTHCTVCTVNSTLYMSELIWAVSAKQVIPLLLSSRQNGWCGAGQHHSMFQLVPLVVHVLHAITTYDARE